MTSQTSIKLGEIMAKKTGAVDPRKFPEEIFDLYSIAAFDQGEPETLKGKSIGSSKQVVQPQDVLLSKIVPHIRRCWIVGDNRGHRLIASGEWIVFRTKKTNPHYLRQLLLSDSFHAQFMNTVAGVGGSLLRARPARVARIGIPLPDRDTQNKFAAQVVQVERLQIQHQRCQKELSALLAALQYRAFRGEL